MTIEIERPAEPELGAGQWDALALLDGLTRADIDASDDYIAEQKEDIWRDLYAEYDARHFMLRARQMPGRPSPAFERLLRLWWQDERHHAQGFARLHTILFGGSELDLYDQLSLRRADFGRIDHLLDDEFSICVLLAFDELVTANAYRRDMAFYRTLHVPALEQWVRHLVADEARHYANAVKVLKYAHGDRLAVAGTLIDELVRLDIEAAGYDATFVLDHFDETYGAELLHKCANELKRVLGVH